MTEQEIHGHLTELEALLSDLKIKSKEAIESVDEGRPLSESLLLEFSELLINIKSQEEESLDILSGISFDSSKFLDSTFIEMREAVTKSFKVKKSEECLQRTRAAFSAFLRLSSDAEPVKRELQAKQELVSGISEETSLELNAEEHILPYEEFTRHVFSEDISSVIKDLDNMIEHFGYILATALIQKKIYSLEPQTEDLKETAKPSAPAEEKKPKSPKETRMTPASSPMEAKAKPASSSTEIEANPASSSKNGNAKIASPEPIDFAKYGIVLPDSDRIYGELKRTSRKGGPKAASSLMKSIRKFEPTFAANAFFISKMAMKNTVISSEMLFNQDLARIPKLYEDMEPAINFLLKEGYMIKYNLEASPEDCLYGISIAGSKVLLQESCKKFLGAEATDYAVKSELNTAAEFLRYKEAVTAASKLLRSFRKNLASFALLGADNFVTLAGKIKNDRFRLLPMHVTAEDSMDLFSSFLRWVSYTDQTQLKLIITSSSVEDALKWASALTAELNPDFIKSSELYYGHLASDKFIGPDGNESDLAGCFLKKEANTASDSDLEKASIESP
ncbi:MAG: high mobility group family protein [Clostridiales bacterium]|jgi:hypothetical protein|nr:high mobility group family protein [Clostridiales bacterium]